MKFRAFVDVQFGDSRPVNDPSQIGPRTQSNGEDVSLWRMRTEAIWGSAHTPLMFGFPRPDDDQRSLTSSTNNHQHQQQHQNNHSRNVSYHHNTAGGTRRQGSSESFEVSSAILSYTPLRVTVFDQVTRASLT